MFVLKIGGSVIGDKTRAFDFREDVVREIARQVREIGGRWVLIHGGGPFGHPLVKMVGARAYVALVMMELSVRIAEIFNEEGVNAVPLPSYVDYLEQVKDLLHRGWTPLLQGNVTPEGKIISGDDIALAIARSLRPEAVLFASDVDGVYDRWPPRGEPLKEVVSCEFEADAARGVDVTGGMRKKLETISKMPKDVKVVIFNGLKQGSLVGALKGLEGTRVIPCGE